MCSEDEFRCRNDRCIPQRWFEIFIENLPLTFFLSFRVCDHDFDCGPGDTSDEDASCGK